MYRHVAMTTNTHGVHSNTVCWKQLVKSGFGVLMVRLESCVGRRLTGVVATTCHQL